MTDFKDCEYRLRSSIGYFCKNKKGAETECDNCKQNIHLNCDNFNPKKDYCLKYFKENISELKECQEKTVFNDKELARKWSN